MNLRIIARASVATWLFTVSLARSAEVTLNWLDKAPPGVSTGVSWGVPFGKSEVKKDQPFSLKTSDGKSLPLQNWPLAYWPDGTVKWMGFASVGGPEVMGSSVLSPGASTAAGPVVKVTQNAQSISIDTGNLQCQINKQGSFLFESMTLDGKVIATQGRLECLLQNGPELDPATPPARERFLSNIKKVSVEQSGPVRATIKIEGMHKSQVGVREWLPFVVRLYFYAGNEPVKMVHSFVFDGDQKNDFIRGLGITFGVPFREEVQNRHVRLGGEEDGIWSEPIQPYAGGPGSRSDGRLYSQQLAGQRIPNRAEFDQQGQANLDHFSAWADFRLIQPNATGFTIEKRTNPQSAWIAVTAGKRSNGLVYVGDVSGGLAVSLKDCWQSYPTSLEVREARAQAARVNVWLWSPDAPAMDLRHYDTMAHGLGFTYEDVEEDLSTSTPYGVARTHELTLFPCGAVPNKQQSGAQAVTGAKTPLLVCTPKYLHDQRAFGIWSLPDRSTPLKTTVEDYFDSIISYYQKSIDQHNWYGFWDYGDVMHSYDAQRHEWKYDIGGCAWDNSEQGTDMVLWYMFLRSGRPDIYRMAEAMTRHTGEVDCYHLGTLAGLGSRHNVRHWGCGAKEARISMAPYRRFYYYLTTDERTGDIMHEMLQADIGVTVIDPMRKVNPPTEADKQFPARVRGGPDWYALVGNWMTEWERTGDTKYRDKILTGMNSIATFPFGLRTSQNYLWGFFPDTGKLVARDPNLGGYSLANQMGGPETVFELNEMIDSPAWEKVWMDYCNAANGGRLAAYVYYKTKDVAKAQSAVGTATSFGSPAGRGARRFIDVREVLGPEALKPLVEGPDGLVTNSINQTTLEAIQVLDMIADQLPPEIPPQQGGGRGGPRGGGRGRGGAPATTPAPE